MKKISNNQTSSILFVKSNEDTSDIQNAVLRQLGSDKETVIPMSVNTEDCFTATLHLTLTENQLANATYILQAVDSLSTVLFTSTVLVEGNTDETRAYIVEA